MFDAGAHYGKTINHKYKPWCVTSAMFELVYVDPVFDLKANVRSEVGFLFNSIILVSFLSFSIFYSVGAAVAETVRDSSPAL